ncbi:8083_t:CDS:1, partial [Funneliformis mosseae]
GANSSHRGRGGRDRDNNIGRRRDDVQRPPPTHLSVPEIKQAQQETTMANFCSSELSYNGSFGLSI